MKKKSKICLSRLPKFEPSKEALKVSKALKASRGDIAQKKFFKYSIR
jgi:hypothetical protein